MLEKLTHSAHSLRRIVIMFADSGAQFALAYRITVVLPALNVANDLSRGAEQSITGRADFDFCLVLLFLQLDPVPAKSGYQDVVTHVGLVTFTPVSPREA